MNPTDARERKLLAFIIVMGLLVRLMAAWCGPIFLDEGYTYYSTRSAIPTFCHTLLLGDSHLPLYNILVHFITIFSNNLLLMRLPSVIFGTVAVWLAFLVSRRLLGSGCALGLSAFYALSYASFINDTQARCYGLLEAALLWCLYLFLDLRDQLKSGTNPKFNWWLWGLAFFILANTHYEGTVAAGVCALLCLTLSGPWAKRGLACLIICFCCLLPTAWFLYGRSAQTGYFNRAHGLQGSVSEALRVPSYITNVGLSLNALQYGITKAGISLKSTTQQSLSNKIRNLTTAFDLVFYFTAFWGWYKLRRLDREGADILGGVFLVTLLALAVGSARGIQHFQCRYMSFLALPFVALMAASALTRKDSATAPTASPSGRILLVVLIIFSLPLAVLFPTTPYLQLSSWDQARSFISRHRQPSTIVGVSTSAIFYALGYALDKDNIDFDISIPGAVNISYQDTYTGPPLLPLEPHLRNAQLSALLQEHHLIAFLCQDGEDRPGARSWLSENYVMEDSLDVDNMYGWGQFHLYSLIPKKYAPSQPAQTATSPAPARKEP